MAQDFAASRAARAAPQRQPAARFMSGDMAQSPPTPPPRASELALRLVASAARGAAPPSVAAAPGLAPQAVQTEAQQLAAAAALYKAPRVDLRLPAPDPLLLERLGLAPCLSGGYLPWQQIGGATLIATSRPEDFAAHRPALEALFGPVRMVLASAQQIDAALRQGKGHQLAHAAETRVAPLESCRGWDSPERLAWTWVLAISLVTLLALWPYAALQLSTGFALVLLIAAAGLKFAALLAALRPATAPPPMMEEEEALPMISILVALYRESDIAARLVKRLNRLDYPAHRLEILLAVEADDRLTRAALDLADLPANMRVVVAPPGRVKTKPRALNIALNHARGSIIGVYDAEDAPEPDQLRKVAAHFHQAPAEVVCLQGVLDYYNPRSNWLSRCFTLEYGVLFRLILPGVARLRLAVPLGGTTLFFRRDPLVKLGGWDAHNVTEDADLGIRLFRHGLRTELLDSTTREEANCASFRAWVKQRSRWIKGYMMTWMVHMRSPRRLWREIGPRAFCGFQIMMIGACLQSLLAPLLWSFWALSLGLDHSLTASLPPGGTAALMFVFASAFALDSTLAIMALRRSGQRIHLLWCLTLPAYFALATLAAYKALWQVATCPFYWDKTHHGLFDASEAAP